MSKGAGRAGPNPATTRHEPSAVFCPWCELDFEADEPVTEAGTVPGEGDAGVCWNCRKWWEIKGGVRVRYNPTEADVAHLNAYLNQGGNP